jgi:hypothetical protein
MSEFTANQSSISRIEGGPRRDAISSSAVPKINSSRMYEVLSKLREYQFRKRLYDMDRSEVVRSSLLNMFKDDSKETTISAQSSLADMLLPTF